MSRRRRRKDTIQGTGIILFSFTVVTLLFWPTFIFHGPAVVALTILTWIFLGFLGWIIWRNKHRRKIRIVPVNKRPTRHIRNDVMAAVMQRDGGRCRICGSLYNIQFDHIYPWSLGGNSEVDNIQLLCGTHNRQKSNKVVQYK